MFSPGTPVDPLGSPRLMRLFASFSPALARLSPSAQGRLMLILAAMLTSTGGVFVRHVNHLGVPAPSIACIRSLIAGLSLCWALPKMQWSQPGKWLAAGGLFTGMVSCFVLATSLTSAAHATFLQFAYPLLVAVGAHYWLGEKLNRKSVYAVLLGLVGVSIILFSAFGELNTAGLLLGLGAAVITAAYVLVQRTLRAGSPIALCCIYNLMAAVLLAPFGLPGLDLSWDVLLPLVACGVFQLGYANAIIILALRKMPAADAAIVMLLEPILNPIWVYAFLGESIATSVFIGGGFILAAVALRIRKA
jgi:drug/metabolite transporter (DMT)-like permease